jgi:hypothetical protein
MFLNKRLRLFPISRFSNDLKIASAFEQLPHPRAHNVMIIRQEDADLGF